MAEYDYLNNLTRRYVHDNGADQPLVWYEGSAVGASNRRHLFTNWQGSIAAITDSAGAAIAVNAYDAYGIPNDTNIGRFQYTGQIWIPELGLYHYKARAYSPTLGRFMQTDPIGYEDQYNLYTYVGNDPVGRVDPDGEEMVIASPSAAMAAECAQGANACVQAAADRIDVVTSAPAPVSGIKTIVVTATKAMVRKAKRCGLGCFLKKAKRFLFGGGKKCCFVAGTLVDTKDGLKPIEQIKVDDLVWSRDEATGETALKPVTDLIRRHERTIWEVRLTGLNGSTEFFETTDDHPWWISGQGWKTTAQLEAGMAVVTKDGRGMVITSIVQTKRTEATYNLTVADFETYFVGKHRVLVHNCTKDKKRVQQQRERRQERRERQSREEPNGATDQAGNPQKQSGEGYRDRESASRGPSGDRPSGPDRSNNRERNVGVDGEEHSRIPKGPKIQ